MSQYALPKDQEVTQDDPASKHKITQLYQKAMNESRDSRLRSSTETLQDEFKSENMSTQQHFELQETSKSVNV